jgi:16S rRNA (adenine1518-N6/adenine1519-N6)-dimethyltransferase
MTIDKAAPRQTQSYLRNLFEERGLKPKNKLGQSFLIDLNLVDLIVRTGELSHADVALEIGSGTGSLTVRLAENAGAVVSVEIDPAFHALASEAVFGYENVHLLHTDVLKSKNELNPVVLDALSELLSRPGATLKLVANLPYAVATPALANLLLSELPIERMVVTVQWEIAERLTARPATKDYGALAVLVQSLSDVTLVRHLPPSVFWPRPKVESAIVMVKPSAEKRAHVVQEVGTPRRLREFLRDLYVHRRKNLRTALAGAPNARRTKEEVDRKLRELAIDGTVRAETLDLEQHLRLCRAFE